MTTATATTTPAPGGVTVPMTAVQRLMFVAQGRPAYRLPFLYRLPDDAGSDWARDRLHGLLLSSPALLARFGYDPATDRFTQRHAPELLGSLEVPDVGEVADPESECADPAHQPDLRRGLPLTARFLRHGGRPLLHVEYHHLALDGIGAAVVEERLLGRVVPDPDDPAEAFAAYERVAAAERSRPVRRPPSTRPDPPPAPEPRLRRAHREVATHQVRSRARALRVFPRVLLQAAVEDWLASRWPGTGYASVSTWRWTLGLEGAVGNLPALLAHEPPPAAGHAALARALMATGADPTIGPDRVLADHADVVVSYEDFGFARGRYVPVDTHPRFGLYVRIVARRDLVELHTETDRRLVGDDDADSLLDHLVEATTTPLEEDR
ncbi:hypothetical protein [Phycicoccus flavus]|uniref:Condensation domain-containing protein n=1 Tax=Phycicoccus flavus TaxID=2502783 RepID=A0A8T6R246_9MICO|nr:hypothetical protein [Phycicoccus flavus]NHA67694.1 hypothetical protein [Phycicoccus flavus]